MKMGFLSRFLMCLCPCIWGEQQRGEEAPVEEVPPAPVVAHPPAEAQQQILEWKYSRDFFLMELAMKFLVESPAESAAERPSRRRHVGRKRPQRHYRRGTRTSREEDPFKWHRSY